MEKKYLDEKIILYKKESSCNFVDLIYNIGNIESTRNVWQISSKNNVLDRDLIYNKKVFYLDYIKDQDEFLNNFNKEYNSNILKIKNEIITNSFYEILDYSKTFEIIIKKINKWTIFSQQFETDFHKNTDRDGGNEKYVVIVSLDDKLGGEFEFENRVGKEKIHLSLGDVLIYPISDSYTHKEHSCFDGEKYYAVAYF